MRPSGLALPRAARRLACLLAVIACAGCGAGTTTSTSTGSSTHHAAAPSTTTPTTASTTSSPPTTSAGAMPGSGRPQIVVGDKNYGEQFVLGQLYFQALAGQGFNVTLNQNIGPTDVTMQALQTGSLSIYPEYLNVFDSAVAGDPQPFESEGAALAAARGWAGSHGLTLLKPTPFSDTAGLAVTDAYAQINHLRTIGDLRQVQTALTIGGPRQFQAGAPGLPELSSVYGLQPSGFAPMAVGSQYSALAADAVQAADIQTTDGALATGDYTVLADPRHMFGWGNVIPVVSTKALLAGGPAFADTIARVDATLTIGAIRQLNEAVDIAQQDPAVVAKQFLETHGLLSPISP